MSEPRLIPFRQPQRSMSDLPKSPISSTTLWEILNSSEGSLAQRAWVAAVILATLKPNTATRLVKSMERIAKRAETSVKVNASLTP